MNPNPPKMSVEQAYRTLVMVWSALLASQGLFLVIIYFMRPQVFKFDFSKPPLDENSTLIIASALLAIFDLVISFVMSRKHLNQSVAEQNIGLVQTAMITGCSLCESISVMGMILAFAYSYQYFFLWFALGILGMILHFPKRAHLIAASYKQ